MAKAPVLFDIDNIPRELKNLLRSAYYDDGISKESLLARSATLSHGQLDAILSEPDDLMDFRLHKFNKLVRNLTVVAEDVIESLDAESIRVATVSQKSTLLKTAVDTVQRLHDLHLIHMEQNEDFKLARLLAMGREEARTQLMERFRGLAHVLFGSMTPNEVMREMALITGGRTEEKAEAPRGVKLVPGLEVVRGGGEDVKHDDGGSVSSADGEGSSQPTQRIGAFRGIKER